MKKYLLLAMTILITSPVGVSAAEALSKELSGSLEAHPADPNIFSIIFSLLFVICLIYVTGLIYSKLNIVGANTVKKQLKDYDLSHVAVLSTTQLGQGKNLHVIEINKKRLLIGAAPNSVNLLKELEENEAIDEFSLLDNVDIETGKESDNITSTFFGDLESSAEEEVVEEFSLHKKYL